MRKRQTYGILQANFLYFALLYTIIIHLPTILQVWFIKLKEEFTFNTSLFFSSQNIILFLDFRTLYNMDHFAFDLDAF